MTEALKVLPFYLSRDILQEFEEGELEFGDEAGGSGLRFWWAQLEATSKPNLNPTNSIREPRNQQKS